MRAKSKTRGAMLLAIMSAFVLVFSAMQPISTVAAYESLQTRVSAELKAINSSSVSSAVEEAASVSTGNHGTAQKMAQVVDANLCAELLGLGLLDVNGYVTVSASELSSTLTNLILRGQISLGSLLNLNAVVSALTSGACVTESEPPAPPPAPDPEPTDPEPTDPEPTNPEPVDPEPTDPEPTDPEPTDPEPAAPEPTDPEPTDPEPADSEPNDPEPTDPESTDSEPADQGQDDTDGNNEPVVMSTNSGGIRIQADTPVNTLQAEPIVSVELCALLLNNQILEADGTVDANIDNLFVVLATLFFDGQLNLTDIAQINALVEVLGDGGCTEYIGTDGADQDGNDGTEPGGDLVEANICAILLSEDVIDLQGNVVVDPTNLTGILTELDLGSLADVQAFIEILTNGGCVPASGGGDTDDGIGSDDTSDPDGTDGVDPIVEAEVCVILLDRGLLTIDGTVDADVSTLALLVQELYFLGLLNLDNLADIDLYVGILQDLQCDTGADAADSDGVDTDSADTDGTDADGNDPDGPVIEAEVCAILLSEEIINLEGDVIVDMGSLEGLLSGLLIDQTLDLSDFADVTALVQALGNGECGTGSDGGDTDATDTDATDTDSTDTDATDTDSTDSDATDTDATDTDATDTDATDTDATDTDATDADATDSDATDSDATDTDATDSDATDAVDGNDGPSGVVNITAYECATVGETVLEYKSSTEPAVDATGCESGTVTLTFTAATSGDDAEAVTYVTNIGVVSTGTTVNMPYFQAAQAQSVPVAGNHALELPVGSYAVGIEGTDITLVIDVAEGENPNLVASVLAQAQTGEDGSDGEDGGSTVTGLPSTGSGGHSGYFWPAAAAASVLILLAGQFVVGTVRNRK